MTRYLIQRVILMIPVLLGITLINFAIYSLAPGDPVSVMLDPIILEGGGGAARLTNEYIAEAKARLGLNQPWPVRYIRWLGEILRGNFGKSLITSQPVSALIPKYGWPSLQLNLVALLVGSLIGIGFGLLQALRQYSIFDYVASFLAFFYVSMPGFFLALILIYIFSLRLGWLPAANYETLGAPPSLGDHLRHLLLPAATLALGGAPTLMRITRTSMLEVLHQPYVTTARAKGLYNWNINIGHVFRNGLIPVITVLGGRIPALISGSFIVENVFNWPGMGVLTIQSIGNRDYPVVLALVLVTSTLTVVAILITDVLYTFVDPRIRYN